MEGATSEQIKALRRPIPLKWRVQRAFPNKANPTHVIMVGYLDARDIQNILDENLGAENWQVEYFECKGKQFCRIGVLFNGQWIWKGDSGSPSQTEREKGETSDSFKRAAVHWGINRHGYQTGEIKLPAKMYSEKPYPCDETGKFLKGKDLFDTCNRLAEVDKMEVEFDKEFSGWVNSESRINTMKETIKGKKQQLP